MTQENKIHSPNEKSSLPGNSFNQSKSEIKKEVNNLFLKTKSNAFQFTENAEELWQLIVQQVKPSISDDDFENFFEETMAISYINKKLFVQTHSSFNKLWLSNSFKTNLNQALESLNLNILVEFITANEDLNQINKTVN